MKHVFIEFLDPDRFFVALSAMAVVSVLGLLIGAFQGNCHSFLFFLIDKILGGFGDRLDRPHRKKTDLLFRSLVITFLGLVCSFVVASVGWNLVRFYPYYHIFEIVFLSLLLTMGSVWKALFRLYKALKKDGVVPGTFYAISSSTRTDLGVNDNFGITRAGLALAARSFDKGLVAPLFWYLIAGFYGAFIYSALAALAWRFGKDGTSKGFGQIPLFLEKLFGFIPSIIAGLLIVMGGLLTPTGRMAAAFRGAFWGENRAKHAEGGVPVTALAYALKVSLNGPAVDLGGSTLKRAWVGPRDSSAQLTEGHLKRVLYIIVMAQLTLIACLLVLYQFILIA